MKTKAKSHTNIKEKYSQISLSATKCVQTDLMPVVPSQRQQQLTILQQPKGSGNINETRKITDVIQKKNETVLTFCMQSN